jgi:hypothetical protein
MNRLTTFTLATLPLAPLAALHAADVPMLKPPTIVATNRNDTFNNEMPAAWGITDLRAMDWGCGPRSRLPQGERQGLLATLLASPALRSALGMTL